MKLKESKELLPYSSKKENYSQPGRVLAYLFFPAVILLLALIVALKRHNPNHLPVSTSLSPNPSLSERNPDGKKGEQTETVGESNDLPLVIEPVEEIK